MPVKAKKEEVLDVKFVEQNIPKLIATYPGVTGEHPSSWFCVNQEGNGNAWYDNACHSTMCYADKGKWDELYTGVPKDDEIGIAYQRMLIHGPFKAYSDLISLEQHGKHYVLHVTDLDKIPANVLYNFCVASRVPVEHSQLLKPWYDGVQLGFDPTLSFLLSYSTNGQPFDKKRTFNGDRNQTNHFWFYKDADWMRIIKGDVVPNVLSKPYKEHPGGCRPTNVIWGAANYNIQFAELTAEAISEKLGVPIEPLVADPEKPAALPKKQKPNAYLMAFKPFPAEFLAPPHEKWDHGFLLNKIDQVNQLHVPGKGVLRQLYAQARMWNAVHLIKHPEPAQPPGWKPPGAQAVPADMVEVAMMNAADAIWGAVHDEVAPVAENPLQWNPVPADEQPQIPDDDPWDEPFHDEDDDDDE